MKISLQFYYLFFISTHIFCSHPRSIESFSFQAQQWAKRVLQQTQEPETLIDFLTLLHDSYMRSCMTLKVQSDYLDLFNHIGSGWHHIVSTRLDPSKDADFDPAAFVLDADFVDHSQLFQQTAALHKKYIDTLKKVVEDKEQKFIDYKKLLDALREGARTVVAESLIETIADIENKLKKAQQSLLDAAALWSQEGHIKSGYLPVRSVTELLWHYVPGFMIKSFVNFDRGCVASNQGCFAAYMESQQATNLLWQAIEIPRCNYYAAHYHALYAAIRAHVPEYTVTLPAPETLSASASF
jgi:hypothetical protein